MDSPQCAVRRGAKRIECWHFQTAGLVGVWQKLNSLKANAIYGGFDGRGTGSDLEGDALWD
jgi:hypothetical protein